MLSRFILYFGVRFLASLLVVRAGDDRLAVAVQDERRKAALFRSETRVIHTYVSPWQNGGDRMLGGAVIRLIR